MLDYIYFFFFNDTATTEIYTLSLHDALPISGACVLPWPGVRPSRGCPCAPSPGASAPREPASPVSPFPPWLSFRLLGDRKSTRLNSSHANISYAVFCLKKKNK